MTSSCTSYYDIDAILAEEELIPCTTLFDFSHLAHLDPDSPSDKGFLPEGSRVKMPLWGMEKWAMLGFVRLSLPRHYGRKARERLEADPGDADLRKRNERFFMAGRMLVELVDKSTKKVAKAIASTPGWRNARRTAHTQALERVSQEAAELRKTLVKTYAGQRLRRTLDWALSSGGDDVSLYTSRLTELEQRLFDRAASAVTAQQHWKILGNRRLSAGRGSHRNSSSSIATPKTTALSRAVTPGTEGAPQHRDKRRRVE